MSEARIHDCIEKMRESLAKKALAEAVCKAEIDGAYGDLVRESTIGEDYIPSQKSLKAVAKAQADGSEQKFASEASDLFNVLEIASGTPGQKLSAVK